MLPQAIISFSAPLAPPIPMAAACGGKVSCVQLCLCKTAFEYFWASMVVRPQLSYEAKKTTSL